MPTDARIQAMIDLAKSQVGYQEGRKNGHWSNVTKYAPALPDLAWAQGQPWCAVFVSWLADQTGNRDFYPRTASVPAAAKWGKARGLWSEYPAIGAQVIIGNYAHTGFVIGYDDSFIWTVEGNTNDNGSAEGDGVYLRRRFRRAASTLGYVYPAFPDVVLESADPAYTPKPEPEPVPTMALGVDYSFARPTPAKIKAAGYVAVGRYLSHSPSKDITADEAGRLHSTGLGIWLVWETSAKRAAGTFDQGVTDATEALARANTIGYPADAPLFFAVDFDATWAQVHEYLRGVRSVKGVHDRAGVYGGYRITTAARRSGFAFTWQTMAWSGGRIDTDANLFQRIKPTVVHPVSGTDENLIQRPFPLWLPKERP